MQAQLLQLLQEEDFPVDDLQQSIADVRVALSEALHNLEQASSDRQLKKIRTEVDKLERILDLSALNDAASQLDPSHAAALVDSSKTLSELCCQRKFLESSLQKSYYSEDRRNASRTDLRQNILDTLDVLFTRRDLLQANKLILLGTKSTEELIDEATIALMAIENDLSASSARALRPNVTLSKDADPSSAAVARWETFASIFKQSFRRVVAVVEQSFTVLHDVIIRGKNDADAGIDRQESTLFFPKFCAHWEDFSRYRLQMFAFDAILCHSSFERDTFCKETFERLQSEAENFSMTWANSNAQLWFDKTLGPLEMAKLFCRSLGANCSQIVKFEDFNMVSLLRIMTRCSFFCSPAPISNPSGIFECIAKRDTVQGCRQALKHWSSFGRDNVGYSEEDFTSACCLFADLSNQLMFFHQKDFHFLEYLRSTIENYLQTPFKFADHRSYVSSIQSESTFPIVRSGSSARSESSYGLDDDDYQKAVFADLDREHQEALAAVPLEEREARAIVQHSFHFDAVSNQPCDLIMTGVRCLDLCLAGIRPFVRMVLRQLQYRIGLRFQSRGFSNDSEMRDSISRAFLESHSNESRAHLISHQRDFQPEIIFEEEALVQVARFFVDDSSNVYGRHDILSHGSIELMLQIVANCAEFNTFACFFNSTEDQVKFNVLFGAKIHQLRVSTTSLHLANECLNRAETADDFSESNFTTAQFAAKNVLSAVIDITSHFVQSHFSVEPNMSAVISLKQLHQGVHNSLSFEIAPETSDDGSLVRGRDGSWLHGPLTQQKLDLRCALMLAAFFAIAMFWLEIMLLRLFLRYFAGNRIRPEEAHMLVELLGKLTSLRKLYLEGTCAAFFVVAESRVLWRAMG
jgi:hypothetical protein